MEVALDLACCGETKKSFFFFIWFLSFFFFTNNNRVENARFIKGIEATRDGDRIYPGVFIFVLYLK